VDSLQDQVPMGGRSHISVDQDQRPFPSLPHSIPQLLPVGKFYRADANRFHGSTLLGRSFSPPDHRRPPGITDPRADEDDQIPFPDFFLPEPQLQGQNGIELPDVSVMIQINRLVPGQPQLLQNPFVGRPLHVKNAEIIDVPLRITALGQGLPDRLEKVADRPLLQPPPHPPGIRDIQQVIPPGDPLRSQRLLGSPGPDHHVIGEGAVGEDETFHNFVSGQTPPQNRRPRSGCQIEQEPGSLVPVIHQVHISVSAGQEHRADRRIGEHHVLRQLEPQNERPAALGHVEGPGPPRPHQPLQVNPRGPNGVFLVLFTDVNAHIDLLRIDSRPGDGPPGGAGPHLTGVIVISGYRFLHDPHLFFHHLHRQAGGRRYLPPRHHPFRKIDAGGQDADPLAGRHQTFSPSNPASGSLRTGRANRQFWSVPTIPLGKKRTAKMYTMPNKMIHRSNSGCTLAKSVSASCVSSISAAPTMPPTRVPTPPMMVISSTSKVISTEKTDVLTKRRVNPYISPLRPARIPDRTLAATL